MVKSYLTEGASQRVQEDTLKFARIMEGLGTGLSDSIMTLIAFTNFMGIIKTNKCFTMDWFTS